MAIKDLVKKQTVDKSKYDMTGKVGLIYGPSGSGKTYMATTFPKPIILGLETNALEYDIPTQNLTGSGYKGIMEFLSNVEESDREEFQTIIIDSITVLDEIIKDEVVQEMNMDSFESGTSNGKPVGYNKHYSVHKGKFNNFINYVSNLSAMGFTVLFIAHSKDVYNDTGDVIGTDLSLAGSNAEKLKRTVSVGIELQNKPYMKNGKVLTTGDLQHINYKPKSASAKEASYSSIRVLGNYVPVDDNSKPIYFVENNYNELMKYINLGLEQKRKIVVKTEPKTETEPKATTQTKNTERVDMQPKKDISKLLGGK